MCKLTLNAVVTRALVDDQFREALLSGQTGKVLQEFPLGEEERRILGSIRADDLEGFVAQIHYLIHEEPVSLPYVVNFAVPSSAVRYSAVVGVG